MIWCGLFNHILKRCSIGSGEWYVVAYTLPPAWSQGICILCCHHCHIYLKGPDDSGNMRTLMIGRNGWVMFLEKIKSKLCNLLPFSLFKSEYKKKCLLLMYHSDTERYRDANSLSHRCKYIECAGQWNHGSIWIPRCLPISFMNQQTSLLYILFGILLTCHYSNQEKPTKIHWQVIFIFIQRNFTCCVISFRYSAYFLAVWLKHPGDFEHCPWILTVVGEGVIPVCSFLKKWDKSLGSPCEDYFIYFTVTLSFYQCWKFVLPENCLKIGSVS